MSPEVVQQISIIRQKMVEGTATVEELRDAVQMMREDRKAGAALPSGSSSRKKMAKAAVPSADDMLDELGK